VINNRKQLTEKKNPREFSEKEDFFLSAIYSPIVRKKKENKRKKNTLAEHE
jgi:hypothetical protein